MAGSLTRRQMLTTAVAGLGATCTGAALPADSAPRRPASQLFRFCLNTSTIRGQQLSIVQEIEIAAKAGYDGIEPWIRELDEYVKGGGSLRDLRKRIEDAGLTVEDAIGFPEWIVDDPARRQKGLDEAKRGMEMVRELGGSRLAAPPVGATDVEGMDLRRIAERYRALLEVGDQMGVLPLLEVWGFSKTLNRLSDATFISMETDHPNAAILSDVYHLYKGGSSFHAMKLLSGPTLPIFHVNDYPNEPRTSITDAHRVYPGDGIAPLQQLFRDLHQSGFQGALSLELFNRDYWKQDALLVAKTGLQKLKRVVESSLKSAG